MEQGKFLFGELIGKKLLIKTHYGVGNAVGMLPGDYKGVLLDFDDKFVKLECEVKRFVESSSVTAKTVILINIGYIITLEEYQERE